MPDQHRPVPNPIRPIASEFADTDTKTRPARPPISRLPQWKVMLHNDDVNDVTYVIKTITKITTLDLIAATDRTKEAQEQGCSLLLTTHRERAELFRSQFGGCNLTVTIEPE